MNQFFEPSPELAPDLEWMLQSGQVSQETLAAGMLREYYAPVYRMALCLLDHTQAAGEVALETFALALLDLHRYSPVQGARQWLFGLALKVCFLGKPVLRRKRSDRSGEYPPGMGSPIPSDSSATALDEAVDAFDQKTRLLSCLYYLENWTPEEIGALMGLTEQAVGARLADARRSFQATTEKVFQPTPGFQNLEGALAEALDRRWPAPLLSESQQTALVSEILSRAGRRSARRRALSATFEAGLVVLAGLVIAGLIWRANLLEPKPLPRGQTVVETVLVTQLITVAVTSPSILVAPDMFATIEPAPTSEFEYAWRQSASENSSWLQFAEMYRRLRQFTWGWRTLWLDATTVSYGPVGYIGPPRVTRMQLWLAEDQMLLLRGDPFKGPQEAILLLLKEGEYFRSIPNQGTAWLTEVDNQQTESISAIEQDLSALINPLPANFALQPGMSSRILEIDQILGRDVYKIEQRDAKGELFSHLWLDQQGGLVLRSETFAQDTSRLRMTDEMMVTALTYDVDFPQALFDPSIPWQGGYALDYTGEQYADETLPAGVALSGMRPRLLKRWMPDGFNPLQSRLTFQYPANFDPEAPQAVVSILADYYWLGDVNFGNPWTMICDRSPDGRKIAFVSRPNASASGEATLNWFSLTHPAVSLSETQQSWQEDVPVTNLAFAPDSQRLAVFGYSQDGGGVYIVNTASGVSIPLLKLADARSLVWSPDGEYLAVIGRLPESPGEDRVMVIQVDNARLVYDQSIDYESGKTEDWPMLEWGIEFPVEMGGLEACVE